MDSRANLPTDIDEELERLADALGVPAEDVRRNPTLYLIRIVRAVRQTGFVLRVADEHAPYYRLVALDEDADERAWQGYVSRGATDPRNLTAAEASACLNSADPERRCVLAEHLEALRTDALSGNRIEMTPSELMASVRVRLGVPSA